MKVSTKGRYAVRLMIDLAQQRDKGYISLSEIAERQGVSKKYLEQIVSALNKRDDFLDVARGFQGGYRLNKELDEYNVAEILMLTEKTLSPVTCINADCVECDRAKNCETLPVWIGLEKAVYDYLSNITLKDIVNGKYDNLRSLKNI